MRTNLIKGIKGVAKYLNVSTTRAHVYMHGKQAILPEPHSKNNGKQHEYRVYTVEQLKPIKYLLGLRGKLEVVKAAMEYLYELNQARDRIADLEIEKRELAEKLEKTRIVAAKVQRELKKDGFKEIKIVETKDNTIVPTIALDV